MLHVGARSGHEKLLADLLRSVGHSVGLYTSPHLHSLRERIRVDGQLSSKDAWAQATLFLHDRTRDFADRVFRDKRYKVWLGNNPEIIALYDLESDPNEHSNRWDDPDFRELRLELTEASFDASVLAAVDVGTERIGPY